MAPGDFYLRDSSRITRRRVVWTHLRNTIYCRATTIIIIKKKRERERERERGGKNIRGKNTYVSERRRKKRERSERRVVDKKLKKLKKRERKTRITNQRAFYHDVALMQMHARRSLARCWLALAFREDGVHREKRSMVEGHVSLSLSLSLSLCLSDRQFTRQSLYGELLKEIEGSATIKPRERHRFTRIVRDLVAAGMIVATSSPVAR